MAEPPVIFPHPLKSGDIDLPDSPEPVMLPWAKVAFDKLFALATIVLTSPVWLVVALTGVLDGLFMPEDRGPLLYHETRVSAGRHFRLTKFRILKVRAIREEIDRGEIPKLVENRPQNLTVVGKALKKTGLDELPQFVNILLGDMSVVGPRPKPVAEYDAEVGSGINRRSVIRAGLTGPAQLLKGTHRTFKDDLVADLRYIDLVRRGPWWRVLLADLGIALHTVRLMLKMTGE